MMRANLRVVRGFWVSTLAVLAFACGCQDAGDRMGPPEPDTLAMLQHTTSSVLHEYYRAIHERRYDDAYLFWADSGAASGKSLAEFRDGFANTKTVDVVLSPPGRTEGAAGSHYVEIPVKIRAVTTSDARQAFKGTYTLRRSMVDGATPEQRSWRIFSAEIRRDTL